MLTCVCAPASAEPPVRRKSDLRWTSRQINDTNLHWHLDQWFGKLRKRATGRVAAKAGA